MDAHVPRPWINLEIFVCVLLSVKCQSALMLIESARFHSLCISRDQRAYLSTVEVGCVFTKNEVCSPFCISFCLSGCFRSGMYVSMIFIHVSVNAASEDRMYVKCIFIRVCADEGVYESTFSQMVGQSCVSSFPVVFETIGE